jgi:16S rRNA (guanine527-N7)-methyltransferase
LAADGSRHHTDGVPGETTGGDSIDGFATGPYGGTTSWVPADGSAPDASDASDVSRETTAADPLEGSAAVQDFFGPAFSAIATLVAMLEREGVERGLIGPHELGKLWERHALNSAAAVPFLPTTGRLIDVGTGAGFPGLVLAAMRPDQEVVLVEPMERRTLWLAEVVAACGLANVVVTRARAEDLVGVLSGRGVTARAVAPLDRLARWTLPLLEPGGTLVAIKGRRAAEELANARRVLRTLGAASSEVLEAPTIHGVDSTTVVRVVLHTGRQ